MFHIIPRNTRLEKPLNGISGKLLLTERLVKKSHLKALTSPLHSADNHRESLISVLGELMNRFHKAFGCVPISTSRLQSKHGSYRVATQSRDIQSRAVLSIALFFAVCMSFSSVVEAQVATNQTTNTVIGVADRDDKQSRSPVVTVSAIPGATNTRLLVDAYQRNDAYARYPMQFDFYINRKLFSSQYRSNRLPGPVGVDIGPDVATLPFNYAVVVKVLTPHGDPYTTVVESAVFANFLNGQLDCTVSFISTETADFVKNAVEVRQIGNESLQLSFEDASAIASSNTVSATFSATIDTSSSPTNPTMTGTLTTTINGMASSMRTETVTGTATLGTDSITAISVSSEDSSLTLKCS